MAFFCSILSLLRHELYVLAHNNVQYSQSVGWNKAADLLHENGRRLVWIIIVDLVNLHPSYTYKVLERIHLQLCQTDGYLYSDLPNTMRVKKRKSKSQFIAKYNYKDFALLSPQRVAINGAIICWGFEPGVTGQE